MNDPRPRDPEQVRTPGRRIALRIAGVVFVAIAVALFVTGGTAVTSGDLPSMGRFWLFFLGIPVVGLGSLCLAAAGAETRTGNGAPARRESPRHRGRADDHG